MNSSTRMRAKFSPQERLTYLKQFGSHCMAYSTLQPGMEYFDLPGVGYLAYMEHGRTRFVLAEPICAEADQARMIAEALHQHASTCFVGLREATARILCSQFGYRATQMGIETDINLENWDTAGKQKWYLRRACNSCRNQGIRISEENESSIPLRDIASCFDRWRQTRKVHRRRLAFLARGPDHREIEHVRRFIARRDTEVVGFALFEPSFENSEIVGFTPGVSASTSHLAGGLFYPLLAAAADVFKFEGVRRLHLGLSPLSRRIQRPISTNALFEALLWCLHRYGSVFYNFEGIEFAKSRFHGHERPVYFAHRSPIPVLQVVSLFRLCRVF